MHGICSFDRPTYLRFVRLIFEKKLISNKQENNQSFDVFYTVRFVPSNLRAQLIVQS